MFLLFNQTCLNEGLLLNNTYFKKDDPAAHNDADSPMYRHSLMKRQNNNNKEKINT